MARKFAKISTTIWHSKKFRSLGAKDRPRLLYFFLHTCPQANSVGCFHAPLGYLIADLGWGENQIAEALQTLREAILIGWDEFEEIVRIIDYLSHDPPTNQNHAQAMAGVIQSLPDCREKLLVASDLLKSGHASNLPDLQSLYERLSEAFPEAIETPFTFYPSPSPRSTSQRSVEQSARGASRPKMPEDWPSKADQENALAYWTSVGRGDLHQHLEREVTKARAHHLGKGTRSPNWSQVWVTWYTRAVEYTRAPSGPSSSFPTAKILKVV